MPPKKAVEATPQEEAAAPVQEDVGEQLDGEFLFQDGSTYSGQYYGMNEDVCLHGKGVLVTGPESFRGTFEKGCYKEGKYTACSGAVYTGAFRDNLYHGFGEYHWPNGRAYKGTWKDGFMHGRGLFMNFSYGVDKVFTGFSVDGRFASNREEQETLKRRFLEEYCSTMSRGAAAALTELVADAAKGGFLVPAAPGEDMEAEAAAAVTEERNAVLEMVDGPFPEEAGDLGAFAAQLDEASEKPLIVNVLEEKASFSNFDGARMKREQLQHVGQAVAFVQPAAEPGAVACVVLVNVSKEFDASMARWKLVHVDHGATA